MRKYGLVGAAAIAMMSVSPVSAAPSFLFTPSVYTPTATSATASFEGFDGPTGAFTTRSNGFATETSTGTATVFPGSENVVGTAVNPDGGTDNYLAIGGSNPNTSGTFTVDFTKGGSVASAIQYFSFAFGSLDNYNTLTLNFASGPSLFLSGTGIVTGNTSDNTPSGASAASSTTTGRLNIYMNGGPALNSAVFGSSQAAFEIDALVAAVPEPATWALMILGFGMVGGALRVRRRQATVAFA